MKWYTLDWQRGALSDQESDARGLDYGRYIRSVSSQLSPAQLAFGTPHPEFDVNDAKLDIAIVDRNGGSLSLSMINGDLQLDYGELTLQFADIDPMDDVIEMLKRLADDRETEFLRQELEVLGSRFRVGFLMWPLSEFVFTCSTLDALRTPLQGRGRDDHRSVLRVL